MVMSVLVSVYQFTTLFSYMLWHIELKFCMWLCFYEPSIEFVCHHFPLIFIRPSSDGSYYGMVMSVRVSVRLSVHPGLRPAFSTLFSYILWHTELKFCTWLCFKASAHSFKQFTSRLLKLSFSLYAPTLLGWTSCLISFTWDQSTWQERVGSDKIQNEKFLVHSGTRTLNPSIPSLMLYLLS